jgi:pyruvate formate lyase activating enzyme
MWLYQDNLDKEAKMNTVNARLYQKLPHKAVRCNLCEHHCEIGNWEMGFCKTRQNQDGVLKSLVYGAAALHTLMPVETQKLYHFLPGTQTYALSTPGCNFRCWWCSKIETARPSMQQLKSISRLGPETIVKEAVRKGVRSISYSYTEPTVFFEYALDTAKLARRAGLANNIQTNGYMTPQMLAEFTPYLDAASVDLKTFRKKIFFSDKTVNLKTILRNVTALKKAGIWVEINTLIVNGLNDEPEDIQNMARFIVRELGPETPWHIDRLMPKMAFSHLPAGDREHILAARQTGRAEGIQYIYIERLLGEYDTNCHACGELLIKRTGSSTRIFYTPEGKCPCCRADLVGKLGDEIRPVTIDLYRPARYKQLIQELHR